MVVDDRKKSWLTQPHQFYWAYIGIHTRDIFIKTTASSTKECKEEKMEKKKKCSEKIYTAFDSNRENYVKSLINETHLILIA